MNLFSDVWKSFMALPLWVKLWMALILMPANFAALYFFREPNGIMIASLAVLGMAFNLVPILIQRGLGKAMSIPHLIFWFPLIIFIVFTALPVAGGPYQIYLIVLLLINTISLVFDVVDTVKWIKGDRSVA